jgi:hypothetical protein
MMQKQLNCQIKSPRWMNGLKWHSYVQDWDDFHNSFVMMYNFNSSYLKGYNQTFNLSCF